jgi:adenine-specific DNA-methyltransferase
MSMAATSAHRQRQGELGQFLTPAPLASFMASMFGPLPEVVRLLDAGAGAGALTTAFVSRLCQKKDGVRSIEATLYEFDPLIQDALSKTMLDCQRVCSRAGIQFTFAIHSTDFIQEMSSRLADDLFGAPRPSFDAAITNPPYRKIRMDSHERRGPFNPT